MKKYLPVVINTMFVLFMTLGFYANIQGAKNIAVFYIWLNIVVGLLYLFVKNKEENNKDLVKFPSSVLFSIEAFIVFTLIWNAWFWTAALYTLSMILLYTKREKEKDDLEKKAKPEFNF